MNNILREYIHDVYRAAKPDFKKFFYNIYSKVIVQLRCHFVIIVRLSGIIAYK